VSGHEGVRCLDFPAAWEIARSVEPEYHHNRCSFNITHGGMLCDCAVLTEHPLYLKTEVSR
jgi:hypothetical protein